MALQDSKLPYLTVKETAAQTAATAGTRKVFFDANYEVLRTIDHHGSASNIGSNTFGFCPIVVPLPVADYYIAENCDAGVLIDQSTGVLHMQHTGQTGHHIRGYARDVAYRPIKLTLAFYSFMGEGVPQDMQAGMFLRDMYTGGGTKAFMLGGNGILYYTEWYSPVNGKTSNDEVLMSLVNGQQGPLFFMQFEGTNTRDIVKVGHNGINWIEVYNQAAAFDRVGWGIYTYPGIVTISSLVHWTEE
jgi:hypothetical protein